MSGDREPTWYVKASFGAEWGPMTTATLLEMNHRDSLGPGDLARCGNDGDWRSVTDVLAELSDSVASPARLTEASNETAVRNDDAPQMPGDPAEEESTTVAAVPAMVTESSRRSGALPGWSKFWTPSVANEPTEALPRIEGIDRFSRSFSEPSSNSQDENSLPTEVAAIESITDNFPIRSRPSDDATEASTPQPDDLTLPDKNLELLNNWKQDRTDELIRLKGIVAQREATIARAAEVAKATEILASTQTTDADATPSEAASESSPKSDRPLSAKPGSNPLVPSAKRRATRQESWEQTLTRWKRSLPDWKFAVLLPLLPLAVWWLWPVSYDSVAATYHAMYDRLREIRDRPLDKSGMDEFVQRSQEQLDALLPRLKKSAKSQDPDTQLLLWIGRDCLQPMLKSPRTRNSKHETMLKKLLAQWDEAHHVVATEEPTESPQSQSEESVLIPPPAGSKPLGFGRSTDSTEPVDTELPPSKPANSTTPRRSNADDEN